MGGHDPPPTLSDSHSRHPSCIIGRVCSAASDLCHHPPTPTTSSGEVLNRLFLTCHECCRICTRSCSELQRLLLILLFCSYYWKETVQHPRKLSASCLTTWMSSGVSNHLITLLPIPFFTITWFLFSGIVWDIQTITLPFGITIFDAK